MTRRIKLVSHPLKTEAEVNRSKRVSPPARRRPPNPGEVFPPAVDISEKKDEIVVELELPGVREKDIKILLYSSRLEVFGFKKEVPASKDVRYHRLEREFGSFRREIFVPGAIDPDRTYAFLENGVLTIVLKKPSGGARDVDIKHIGNKA